MRNKNPKMVEFDDHGFPDELDDDYRMMVEEEQMNQMMEDEYSEVMDELWVECCKQLHTKIHPEKLN